MRDHGGNIDEAITTFGGDVDDWIDLSTGINRQPYPIPDLPSGTWTDLPTQAAKQALCSVAAFAYGTKTAVLPVAGAQAAIQLIPRLTTPGDARVLTPTYNEHAAALSAHGWQVTEVSRFEGLTGANLAVIVNPNNPDGSWMETGAILRLADQVRYLIVDESFADVRPERSIASLVGRPGLLVLRSFGKFYGLAGLRLGFVLGHPDDLATLSDLGGPWSVSGPALAIGTVALGDAAWQQATRERLAGDAERLDALAAAAGWRLIGGTELFRTYATPSAAEAQGMLARHQIWSRVFPYSQDWMRLGLPGNEREWARLQMVLSGKGPV